MKQSKPLFLLVFLCLLAVLCSLQVNATTDALAAQGVAIPDLLGLDRLSTWSMGTIIAIRNDAAAQGIYLRTLWMWDAPWPVLIGGIILLGERRLRPKQTSLMTPWMAFPFAAYVMSNVVENIGATGAVLADVPLHWFQVFICASMVKWMLIRYVAIPWTVALIVRHLLSRRAASSLALRVEA